MQIEVTAAIIPVCVAWYVWMARKRPDLTRARRGVFTAGLILTSLAVIMYVAFIFRAESLGGFKTDFGSVLKWARPGGWVSALGLVLCGAGKGTARMVAVMAAVWNLLLWSTPIIGM